ncbi:dimethylmenaquinone methyltransferase family protein [Halalkalibacter wakoensis JCM 9140]|uniref:Putative 4-hydroxy-4-methyl-2-oxoglutarate aldolase n=1 Tax=Halalkalibacter wakoensis JCM 9140 TaxID=1236970 RepID=W4Q3P2_9BACI|nr:RraA family protein [Halalkalibacter wakoensis]GAE25969.1 dimethylmenaquinone methyltransferase family protein [Halalkalibacter wakoensis JCM 9140]
MENLGFRILPMVNRPNDQLVNEYRSVVTPHISDNLNRIYGASANLRPYHKGGKLIGTALTVKTRPGDNLMVHKAIDIAEPGDIIVVDAGGDLSNAIVGEIMLRLAKRNKIAGFVINGAIRDTGAFAQDDFPVYACGVTHKGPYKDGPGEINVPISLGGMTINAGDIIVGDEDGLVAVPLEKAEEILTLVKKQQKAEEEIMNSIEVGTVDRSWVDKTLEKKGVFLNVNTN